MELNDKMVLELGFNLGLIPNEGFTLVLTSFSVGCVLGDISDHSRVFLYGF